MYGGQSKPPLPIAAVHGAAVQEGVHFAALCCTLLHFALRVQQVDTGEKRSRNQASKRAGEMPYCQSMKSDGQPCRSLA